jgi:glycosyltransferase involved in cell wall biosynthesis
LWDALVSGGNVEALTEVGARRQARERHMSLRIGVDAWNLTGDHRGIGRYVREIVRTWLRLGDLRVRPVLVVPERVTLFARSRYVRELGMEAPVCSRARAKGLDLIWFPWNGMSWLPARPAVATLHDASVFRMPGPDGAAQEKEQRPFRAAALHARRVITDSEFAKEELVRYLGLGPDKIEVIHLGVSQVFFKARPADDAKRHAYLLFVGNVEGRKGLATACAALGQLPDDLQAKLELIIVGDSSEDPLPGSHGKAKVRRVGWIDDRKLAELYAGALALLYPSEYEGFGLPIIEAMASATLVVAADTPSSREVGGSAAMYVARGDSAALAEAVTLIARAAPDTLQVMREKCLVNARAHTWRETATRTLDAIEQAAEEGSLADGSTDR